jgi:2-methylcitrate dehydratase PrpD
VLAAGLAQAGGTGAPDALEGRAGFYAAFLGDTAGLSSIGADLGTTWRTLDVTYKPYAVCAILQEPVRQAIALAQGHDVRPAAIDAVRLRLTPAEAAYPGTDSTGPFSDIGATLMSAPFCLAVALTQRHVKGVDLKRLDDAALMPLVARSGVIPDESLGARSFVLEVDVAGHGTLRRAFHAEGEPFNWNGAEVMDNLRAMRDELPIDAARIEALGDVLRSAERHAARDLVSAAVVG